MNKQRGFTLLEIILALVIFASCAMMVGVDNPLAQRRGYFRSAVKSPR